MHQTTDRKSVYRESIREFLTPIQSLLDNPNVSEILINGPNCVYFEEDGQLKLAPEEYLFPSERLLEAAAINIAEYVDRQLDRNHHSLDARLPDGSRVHVILPPSSQQGICISIRKFQRSNFNIQTLVEKRSLSSQAAEFLELAVRMHKNMVVSGGTGSGKTSLLNALSTFIEKDERIIVIEDSRELQLSQPHTLYLEAQLPDPNGLGGVTIRDLFVDSLRMRPNRIVVGEVRRGEALDLIQSMLSGHEGSLSTVHANNARDALLRLETLCLMDGMDGSVKIPIEVARIQVASAIRLVVQVERYRDGMRRIKSISECLGLNKDKNYRVKTLFKFDVTKTDARGKLDGELKWTGYRPSFAREVHSQGWTDQIKETNEIFALND